MKTDLLTPIFGKRTAARPAPARDGDDPALTTAETAECTCPDFCERDHDNE